MTVMRRMLLGIVPVRSDLLHRGCRWVVDRYRGDNNDDIATNGELRLMRQELPSARTIFDVGANRGDWTALALTVNGSAAYHVFEPTGATFRLLAERAFPPNVMLSRMALGASVGESEMFILENGHGGNSFHDRWSGAGLDVRRERVPMTTLEQYCEMRQVEHIDFLKLDVEGHELDVLRGGESLLAASRIRTIQFEYGGTYLDARIQLRDVIDLVRGANPRYRLFKILPGALLPITQYRQSLDTFQYSNWVFRLQ